MMTFALLKDPSGCHIKNGLEGDIKVQMERPGFLGLGVGEELERAVRILAWAIGSKSCQPFTKMSRDEGEID